MRLYIKEETPKAYKLESIDFSERWIPKKAVDIDFESGRLGMSGTSYEMDIKRWAL